MFTIHTYVQEIKLTKTDKSKETQSKECLNGNIIDLQMSVRYRLLLTQARVLSVTMSRFHGNLQMNLKRCHLPPPLHVDQTTASR